MGTSNQFNVGSIKATQMDLNNSDRHNGLLEFAIKHHRYPDFLSILWMLMPLGFMIGRSFDKDYQ